MRSPLDNEVFKKLKGYKLGDTPPLQDESSEIGILTRNDHYGEILMSGKVEIDKGLYLLENLDGSCLDESTQNRNQIMQ